MRFVDVVVIGESGCDFLGLLEACVILRLSVFSCVSSDKLSPVSFMSNVGLFGSLRLVLSMFRGWWFELVGVRLIRGRFCSGVVTKGEY